MALLWFESFVRISRSFFPANLFERLSDVIASARFLGERLFFCLKKQTAYNLESSSATSQQRKVFIWVGVLSTKRKYSGSTTQYNVHNIMILMWKPCFLYSIEDWITNTCVNHDHKHIPYPYLFSTKPTLIYSPIKLNTVKDICGGIDVHHWWGFMCLWVT